MNKYTEELEDLIAQTQGFLEEAIEKYGHESTAFAEEIQSIVDHIDYHQKRINEIKEVQQC